MTTTAYCGADGRLRFGPSVPRGMLPIASCPADKKIKTWRSDVQALCRLGYTRGVYLVPGIPEATSEHEAFEALCRFSVVLGKLGLNEKPLRRQKEEI